MMMLTGEGQSACLGIGLGFFIRCTRKIGLRLELGSKFNIRMRVILRFNIMVRCGLS